MHPSRVRILGAFALPLVLAACGDEIPTGAPPADTFEPTLQLGPDSIVVQVFDSVLVTRAATDSLGVEVERSLITLVTEDTLVAVVSGDRVLGTGVGRTRLVALFGGLRTEIPIEVLLPPLSEIRVFEPAILLGEEGEVHLLATALDGESREVPGAQFKWFSEDPTVAAVDDDGVVVGGIQGSTRVEARAGGLATSVDIEVELGWKQVSGSFRFACALTVSGTAYCWGPNTRRGVLGIRGSGSPTEPTEPVEGDHEFTRLSLSPHHACGLKESGEVWCWGQNHFGQLGIGRTVFDCRFRLGDCSEVPLQVVGDYRFSDLNSGDDHTCGITTPGERVVCWGLGGHGELGVPADSMETCYDGSNRCSLSPIRAATDERFQLVSSADWGSTCGLTVQGDVYCWGATSHFRHLLDNSVCGESSTCGFPQRIQGLPPFTDLSRTRVATCGLKRREGAWCWGWPDVMPVLVPGTSGIVQLAVAAANGGPMCGLAESGTALCWNPREGESWPLPGDLELKSLALGMGEWLVCGITVSNLAYCWALDGADGVPPKRIFPPAT